MQPRQKLTAAFAAAALVLSVPASADAAAHHAKPIKPKLGIWEAAPKGVTVGYNVGGWTLSRKNGHLIMSADPDFNGMYYPDANKCGGMYEPGLTKPTYRVSKKNKFRIKDTEAQQTVSGKPLVQHVIWTGIYFKKKQVKGKISIWVTKPAKGGAKPKVVCRDMHRGWGGGTA